MSTKLGIVIGRFQPVHHGHIKDVILPALQESDYVLFLLGSVNRSTNSKNPFTFEERKSMIQAAIMSIDCLNLLPHVRFAPLLDYSYSDERWLQQVQSKVREAVKAIQYVEDGNVDITLYGSDKDASSYYVHQFPQWNLALGEPNNIGTYSATNVRKLLFADDNEWKALVPASVVDYIKNDEGIQAKMEAMKAEVAFIERYKSQYQKPYGIEEWLEGYRYEDEHDEEYPGELEEEAFDIINSLNQRNYYDPFFVTVDSVVLFRGQVLLIKRGHQPGKGLWALPGGFLSQSERLLASAIREVREETGFRLKPEWLVAQDVFDDPSRSLRGRTVTHGFLFKVPDTVPDGTIDHIMNAQFVKGQDDAAEAKWVPLADALEDPEFTHNMFEDHSDILYELIQRA